MTILGTRPLVETQRGVNLFRAYMNDIIVSQMKKMISPMSRKLIDSIIYKKNMFLNAFKSNDVNQFIIEAHK